MNDVLEYIEGGIWRYKGEERREVFVSAD